MKAIVMTRHGGPEVLRPTVVPDPEVPPGHALVETAAAGVNFIDVYRRTGAYPGALPAVPGVEGAGTVVAVGDAMPGNTVSVGDRVGWVNQPGGYAELVCVPANRLVPVPSDVPLTDAAAVLLQGMTAHYLTRDTYRIHPGDTVLVHAAAGGLGLLLTQLAVLRGATVVGTASTVDKQRLAVEAGAAIAVPTQSIVDTVREVTGGAGVHAVYDGIGGPTFEANLACLRPRGTLAIYGQAGGPVPPVDVQALNAAGSLFLTRPNLEHHIASRTELSRRAADVLGLVGAGRLRVHVGGRYPLAGAAAAHADLEQRRSTGKLLLMCPDRT